MTTESWRYYVRSPNGWTIVGYDDPNVAGAAALDHGDGAHLIDTQVQAYHPIAQEVMGGELVYADVGGWGAGKLSVDRNLIESVKKGYLAIVHAFLAKGADPDARDGNGAPALIWAVARGKADVLAMLIAGGADVNARDGEGTSALDLAMKRDDRNLIALLQKAGVQ